MKGCLKLCHRNQRIEYSMDALTKIVCVCLAKLLDNLVTGPTCANSVLMCILKHIDIHFNLINMNILLTTLIRAHNVHLNVLS